MTAVCAVVTRGKIRCASRLEIAAFLWSDLELELELELQLQRL